MPAFGIVVLFFVAACFVSTKQQIPGGEYEGNPNDAETMRLLQKVVDLKNSKSNEEPKKIMKITKSVVQVVSGRKHTVTFLTEGTNSKSKHQCKTIFVDAPWVSSDPDILEYSCQPV